MPEPDPLLEALYEGPMPAQLEESFRMIPRMWREEAFDHDGLIRVSPRPIHSSPLQKPHPPLFLACTHEATLNQAGEWGVGALCLGFAGPEDIAKKNRVYRAALARCTPASRVGEVVNAHLSALCPALVLDDGTAARRIGLRGQRFFAEAIQHWYGSRPPPTLHEGEDDAAALRENVDRVVAYLHEERIEIDTEVTGFANPNHAYGTTRDAIGYVERLLDAGADEIMFLMQMGTVPHKAILETIQQLGSEVLPHFRTRAGRS